MEEALIREIREELQVEISLDSALQSVEWSDASVSIRLHPWRCRIVSGEPRTHEHEELRWCDSVEAQEIDWAPADLPILAEWFGLRR